MGRNGNETRHTSPPRGKRWWRRILFPLVAIGVASSCALVVAEIGLRLLVTPEAKRLATYDEVLGWRGRPHGQGIYARHRDQIRVPFQYNNLGYRDEIVLPKQPGSKRLLLLGDSFVENLEVPYGDTYPALLEQSLRSSTPGWEVVVLGSQGYSTAQELLAFRKYRELIEPDLVLLCFYCGNDFEDNLRQRFAFLDQHGQVQFPEHQEPAWKHGARRMQRWLYESSHVTYLLKNSLQSLTNLDLAQDAKAISPADEATTRTVTKQLLLQLAQEVEQSGAALGVVVIPDRDTLATGKTESESFIVDVCQSRQLPCLVLSGSLGAEHYFTTDIHFNEAGHAVVASVIQEFVSPWIVSASFPLAEQTELVTDD